MKIRDTAHNVASRPPTDSRVVAARVREIAALYSESKWDDVVRLTRPEPGDPPDVDYYRGMALAKLKRWAEADQAFECGRRKAPRDKRFPTELAGIAFLQQRYGAAKKDLIQALKLDPKDVYANNFIATVFSLEDNLPAALKYWNRIGMPKISRIHVNPSPRIASVLLDRTFTFAPGSTLTASDFRTTQTLVSSLDIFLNPRLDLAPDANGEFAVRFEPDERNGMGETKLVALVSALRGLPYDTVYPEWFNLRHAAMNFTSLLRWDPNKERVFASLSAPFGENPRWRYDVFLDGRRENWNLTNTFYGARTPVNDMQLERVEGGGEVENIVSGRLRWGTRLNLSGRTFRKVSWNDPSAAGFFRNGFAVESRSSLDGLLLSAPERRLTLSASASGATGRVFSRGAGMFAQAEGGAIARWFPRAQGDDYEMTAQMRAGKTSGTVPFDDLFILGLERDNDLWLRAHIGTADGKKGSAPLGRNYALINWDDSKNIYHNGFVTLKLGPFFDTGKITDPSHDFGSREWLFDTGFELKVQFVGSATLEFFYGKDLRTGRSAFYGTSTEW